MTILSLPTRPRQALTQARPHLGPLSPAVLGEMVEAVAGHRELWSALAQHAESERRPVCLMATSQFELWVIGWSSGQNLDLHDHGGSTGALKVVEGDLEEVELAGETLSTRRLPTGEVRLLGPPTVHSIANVGSAPATSLHAYSPPLSTMAHYDPASGARVRVEFLEPARPVLPAAVASVLLHPIGTGPSPQPAVGPRVDEAVAAARRRLGWSPGPAELAGIVADGGLVVDIRPQSLRRAHGDLPDALVIERNVLEWRLDPTSPHRLPEAVGAADRVVVLVCDEGYASSLAASGLRDLGIERATDLDGGYQAWLAFRS